MSKELPVPEDFSIPCELEFNRLCCHLMRFNVFRSFIEKNNVDYEILLDKCCSLSELLDSLKDMLDLMFLGRVLEKNLWEGELEVIEEVRELFSSKYALIMRYSLDKKEKDMIFNFFTKNIPKYPLDRIKLHFLACL